ncbi:hypothetical protein AYY26_20920 [Photobacterium phosphoreum]|uniref:hypothetical protein n=1 Tax=Photobacterium phosphoreum TaxID=659 RepID=UPI0007F9544F|nr:hypothetical protein [Photobacterium phosphoreum]OBU41471.1 hypothetical protein AYY26_20920 [Photobacterium phosphoreum]
MKITKLIKIVTLASVMCITTGCATPIGKIKADTTIKNFKHNNDSYAMNVLSAAWNERIPFNIKDENNIKDADGVSGKTMYGSEIAMGALSNGLSGGLTGLLFAASMDASTQKFQNHFQAIIWMPANGKDINNSEDRKLITDEITLKLLKPMYKDFFKASKKGEITTSTKSGFNYKGSWCSYTDPNVECSMFLSPYDLQFISYADKQHGLPFNTNNNGKYIITRVRLVPQLMLMMKYNKKENMLFYVPPINYFAKFDKIQMKNTPYIQSTTKKNFFVKS